MPAPFGPARADRRERLEALAYALVAGFVTLWVATRFYASLHLQTLHAVHWQNPHAFDPDRPAPWSAPLDDVFIHFDFARATARGFPFQWSEGNGYSSGGTSLTYPLLLALGYSIGFRGLSLMEWAGVVACVSTFGLLLAARRLSAGLPRGVALLFPFGLLSVGALDWTLFSGMEVAWFLAVWGAAFVAHEDLVDVCRDPSASAPEHRALGLGLWCGLLVATRPEGVVAVAVLAASAAFSARGRGASRAALTGAWVVAPACAVILGQAVVSKILTGDGTAAGALVKLELYHPHLDARQVWDAWMFHLKYQVLRVTQYHFADQPVYGWIVWVLAAAALAFERTRRPAAILWASATLWVLLVAANGQVRWQNDRYTMPAVAWFLLAATLGTQALLVVAWDLRKKIRGVSIAGATLVAVGLFLQHQAPRFRDQIWFFGRASRNIYDQHVQAGRTLRDEIRPRPHRILLGDAGAIPYVSDLPALDIIGLGGYHALPFARATRLHVGAGIELIEHIAPADRPDVLALYPSWWGSFPLWFGKKLLDVPVRGNVICGGTSKVLYRADWSPLSGSDRPMALGAGERVVDALDVADLVSEKEHGYRLSKEPGFVSMKLLESPETRRPLWDAGRIVPAGAIEHFTLQGLLPDRPLRLLIRAAPTQPLEVPLRIGSEEARVVLHPASTWVEGSVVVSPPGQSQVRVELSPSSAERVIFHVFAVQGP